MTYQLILTEAVWTRIYLESHLSLDAEVCGAIIDGTEIIMTRNHSKNPSSSYSYDTVDQKYIWSKWDKSRPLVLFHSHPHGEAYPSLPDVEYARNKNVLYLIFSVRENLARLFQIENGLVEDRLFRVAHDDSNDQYRGHHQQKFIAPSKFKEAQQSPLCVCGKDIPDISIAGVESWWRDHVEESRWARRPVADEL